MPRGTPGPAAKAKRDEEEAAYYKKQWARTLENADETAFQFLLEHTAAQLKEITEKFHSDSTALSNRLQEIRAARQKKMACLESYVIYFGAERHEFKTAEEMISFLKANGLTEAS